MRFTRSAHLTALIADSERLAIRLADVDVPPEAARVDRELELLASLRLDGSTMPDLRGWEAAIRTKSADAADERIWELERDGLAALAGDDSLGSALRTDPAAALTDLHARLTEGLLADDRRGRWRVEERAVTDASIGRILYWPTKSAEIGPAMGEMAAWLLGPGAREHPLTSSGWLLLQLLRIQPFDAANGRVARLAARALLSVGNLDPHGVAPLVQQQARDAIGMFSEVASTARRRDATVWLERWGEIVTTALRRALIRHGDVPVDGGVAAVVAQLPDAFTVTDWRELAGANADDRLRHGLDAGLVEPLPGTRGLRYVRAVRSDSRP